jgi:hypothetical protein
LLKRLRSRGFIANSALEAGLLGSNDETQPAYAVSQQKTLISHNRIHFEALAKEYFVEGRKHYGIIIAVRRPPQELFGRLVAVMDKIAADEMENQVLYI